MNSYIYDMKYRLNKELKEYLQEHFIDINEFAEQVGITSAGLHKILSGETKNPYNKTIRKMAENLKMSYARDEQGIYFYEPDNDPEFNSPRSTPASKR